MGTQGSISGIAITRAADAMLRALGGDAISLLFSALTLPNDPAAQLGLTDPGVQEMAFSPVVVRTLPTDSNGPRRRLQFLIPGSQVADAVVERNVPDAEQLFESALGISYDGDLFHIANVVTEYFAGTAYLFLVEAVE
jgi:hypothetical protein